MNSLSLEEIRKLMNFDDRSNYQVSPRLLTACGSSQAVDVSCGLCRLRRHSPQLTSEEASRRRRREVLSS